MSTYVLYCRVSTAKQGTSGLGLEAQQEAARVFVREGDAIVASYIEVESGRNCARPQLAAALADCRRRRATLLIAKIDRLSRNVRFISALMESDIQIIACDMPNADRFTWHVLAACSEQEARASSQRTRVALAAAKARGVKLGGPHRMSTADALKGSQRAGAARTAAARARALSLLPIVQDAQAAGATTLAAVAAELNGQGVPAPRGGSWGPMQVRRVLAAAA